LIATPQLKQHLDLQGTGASNEVQAGIAWIQPGELRRQFNAQSVKGLTKVQ
jgi:hypothetical protein